MPARRARLPVQRRARCRCVRNATSRTAHRHRWRPRPTWPTPQMRTARLASSTAGSGSGSGAGSLTGGIGTAAVGASSDAAGGSLTASAASGAVGDLGRRRRLLRHHARRVPERAFHELVGLDELAAPGAQVADLAFELLAPLLEVGEHALAQPRAPPPRSPWRASRAASSASRVLASTACCVVVRSSRAVSWASRTTRRACSSALFLSSIADSRAWPSTRAVSSPRAVMRSWSDGGSTGLRSWSSSSRIRAVSSRSRDAADGEVARRPCGGTPAPPIRRSRASPG